MNNNRIFEMSVPDLEECGSQVGGQRFPPNYISKIRGPERGSRFDEVKLVICQPAVMQLYSINDRKCSMASELQSEFFFRFSHIIISSWIFIVKVGSSLNKIFPHFSSRYLT